MKRTCIIIFILLLGVIADGMPCREVVGYYAGWKWYKRNKLVNPQTIDYSKYTIINYAFFKPLADGTISEGDAWADKNILLGKVINRNGIAICDSSTSLVTLAHKNGVKVIGSIGGWTWSSAFTIIAASEARRKKFAEACLGLIAKYNLDGIDIDWEYPGFKLHNGTPGDKENFTLLLTEIRNTLDSYEVSGGRKYLLTAAFGPAPDHMDKIEWDKVSDLVDIINLMTYNFYGAWDKITNHNAPLYAPAQGNREYNIHSSISRLTDFYKVPASKIALGIAFYGRSVTMNDDPALHATSTGIPDATTFSEEKGTPSYYSIVAKSKSFVHHWDHAASVPYLTGKPGINSFVSFDDPRSVKLKADYAVSMNLRGVVIWDISGDYIEQFPGSGTVGGNPLCEAIGQSFCSISKTATKPVISCDIGLLAYPNPFRDELVVTWNRYCVIKEILVRNQAGQILFTLQEIPDGILKINTIGWASGIYYIQLVSGDGTAGEKVVKM